MPSSRDTSGAIAITGVGVRSPLGDSFAAVADALLAGRPAIRAVDFGTGMEGVRTLAAPLADGDGVAAVPAAGGSSNDSRHCDGLPSGGEPPSRKSRFAGSSPFIRA